MWDPMDPVLFEKCIRFIRKRFEVCLIEDLVDSPGLKNPKKNFATIMFDDGYKDNMEYALPILDKYNIKASFYVVTDCIEKNIPTWTHQVEYLFQFTNLNDLSLDFEFLPEGRRVKTLNSQTGRIAYGKKLIPLLKKISHEERLLAISEITNKINDVELPKLMMSWNDLRELKKAGHYIGSHSISHAILGTMNDLDEIYYEVRKSGEIIQKHLGDFPKSFSFPIGSFDERVVETCRKSGYKAGLAVKQQPYNPQKDSIFEIPRIELYNEPWWKTKRRITHDLEKFKKLLGYKINMENTM